MPRSELDNLVRVRQLKAEPATQVEFVPAAQWRVLDQAHRKRNLAEYEGDVEIDDALLAALIRVAAEVETAVRRFGPVGSAAP